MGLPIFLLVWKGFLAPLPLYDFWWHLKIGEVIATTGSIPREEVFSFTAAGREFIVQNWLAEVIYYALFRVGGLAMVVFFNTALLSGALIPIYHLCLKSTSRVRLAVVVSLVAAIGMFPHTRPQVFSFVCFAIYHWVITLYRTKDGNHLWVLPMVMLLWVNLHGGFVLGLGLLALVLVCEWSRSVAIRGADTLSRGELGRFTVTLALCGVATLFNPEMHKVYGYVQSVVTDPSSRMFVMEWQPPRILSVQGWLLFYAAFFITIGALIYSRVKTSLTELMLVVMFAVFAMSALRNSIWFALIVPPILARHLAGWSVSLGKFGNWRTVRVARDWLSGLRVCRSHHRINAGIAVIVAVLVVLQSPWVRPRLYGTSLVSAQTPIGAMDYIEERELRGNILHPQVYGDYLMWRLWPKQRSFFDGRVHIFGEEFVRSYQRIFAETHWEELLASYDIRYLLLSKDEVEAGSVRMIAAARGSGRWKTLYEDSLSVLFGEWEVRAHGIGASLD